MYAIYQITNLVNREFYIGFTTENPPERRLVRHKNLAKRGAPGHLYNAMRKNGVSNFSFLILEIGENEEHGSNIAESMYIAWLVPRYNKTDGGDGARGCSPSLETRKKISKTHIGMKPSPEHLRAIREAMNLRIGSTLSDEHKKQISMTMKGRIPWNKGKKFAPVV